MKPIISYYGGKQRIAKHIIPLIPDHSVYVEPFCGGAALLFAKGCRNKSGYKEVINDIDANLINFYRQFRENFEQLCYKFEGTLYSSLEHKKSRYIIENPKEFSDLERAWAYYINIHKSFANTLGRGWGTTTTSKNHAYSFRRKIQGLSDFMDRLKYVHIDCDDALRVIKRWDSKDTFFYCDPPYPNTHQGHYDNYSENHLFDLVRVLNDINGSCIISCNNQDKFFDGRWKKVEIESYVSSPKKKRKKSIECLYIKD